MMSKVFPSLVDSVTLTQSSFPSSPPADQDVCDWSSFDGPVAAEGEAGLAMDVLGVPCVGAIVALIDGHVYPSTFWMILEHSCKYSAHSNDNAPRGLNK